MKRSLRRLLLELGGGLTYDQYIASLAPLLWYKFNETGGTAVINYGSLSSGNGVWTPGVGALGQTGLLGANQAYLFDALDSLVTGPASANINNANQFTYASLVKVSSAGEASAARFHVDNGQQRSLFFASSISPFRLNWQIGAATTSGLVTSNAGQGLITNTWAWLFCTYDDTTDRRPHIFKGQGGAMAELAYSANNAAVGTLNNGSGALLIGNRPGSDRTLDGYYDELLFFNRILSTTEMTQITLLSAA